MVKRGEVVVKSVVNGGGEGVIFRGGEIFRFSQLYFRGHCLRV
jgi:hypothetical protein